MGLGPAWQPPTAAKSWPGAAGRDESSLRFDPDTANFAQRGMANAAGSEKLRGGVSI